MNFLICAQSNHLLTLRFSSLFCGFLINTWFEDLNCSFLFRTHYIPFLTNSWKNKCLFSERREDKTIVQIQDVRKTKGLIQKILSHGFHFRFNSWNTELKLMKKIWSKIFLNFLLTFFSIAFSTAYFTIFHVNGIYRNNSFIISHINSFYNEKAKICHREVRNRRISYVDSGFIFY